MPFELNDPNALPGLAPPKHVHDSTTPKAASVADELNQMEAEKRFSSIAAGLRPGIQAELAEAQAEAEARIFKSAEASIIRNAANQFVDAWLEHDRAGQTISQMTDLSASGRENRRARLTEVRLAAIAEAVDRGPSQAGDALLALYPPARPGPIAQALIAESGLILQTAGYASGEGFLDRLYTSLTAARSTASTPEEQHRHDVLLDSGFFPVANRRAFKPESWAQVLMSSYHEAHDLVKSHLKIRQGGFLHDGAAEFVANARQEFTFINQSCLDNNGFDDVLRVAAPTLFPSA